MSSTSSAAVSPPTPASALSSSSHTPLTSPSAAVPRNLPYPFLLSPSVSQRRLVSQSSTKRHSSSHSQQHRGSSDTSRHYRHQQQHETADGSDTSDDTALDDEGGDREEEAASPEVGRDSSSSSGSSRMSHGSITTSPLTHTARGVSCDMADKQQQALSDKLSHLPSPLHQPLSLPQAYKLLAAAAEGSKSSISSPSSFSPHLLSRSVDEEGPVSPSLASLLSATDPLSTVAPLWSSFSSSSPPPAIHTSFINTLLLSDRSCLILCLLNFAIWSVGLLVLLLLIPHLPGGYYPDTYHSGFWHGFHVWCCLAATLLLFVLFSTPSSKKQRISAIALCILLVCVFTYLVFALQLLPVYTDLFGHELYPLRYVEWVCTTPLMLLLVCNLDVQPRGMVVWIVAADVAMILTGLLASISPNYSVMLIWLVVSFMCELDTLTHMHSLFVQYRQLVGAYPRILLTINFLGKRATLPYSLSPHSIHPLSVALTHLCLCRDGCTELWLYAAYCWFPAIWCLAAAGLITDDSTNNLYFIGDTMGKLLYTAALLIINFEIVDHQGKQATLSRTTYPRTPSTCLPWCSPRTCLCFAGYTEQLHRVQYEAEMRIQMINEKMRSQEESRRQALVSNERKREFLRYILHEIRVPLNALVLGLEGLKTSVESTAAGSVQHVRDSTAASSTATAAAHHTPVVSARVKEEDEEDIQQDEESSEQADKLSQPLSFGESVLLPGSPHRSPLASPTLDRSPLLFSNSSILPSTTSLSRASSLALSAASSASSPGHPSPIAGAASVLSSSSSVPPSSITLCDEDADSINEMWHAVSHMTRLLDDVLSLQRIEDGELLLERRAFSLPDTCVGAVRMMTTWLDNKGLTVQCDVDSSLPIVISDEYRVRQVLINFLSNAIRFTPGRDDDGSEGRITLTVKRCDAFGDCEPIIQEGQSEEVRRVSRDSSRVKDDDQPQQAHTDNDDASNSRHQADPFFLPPHPHSSAASPSQPSSSPSATSPARAASQSSPPRLFIRVSVHDSGIGIPLSDLQRMFTPFVQISSGEAEKGKGTGLGLSICRKLIDLLGGRVGVISAPGKGSTFFFEAPFEVSAEQNPALLRSADQLAGSEALNADEASSRTINKPPTSSGDAKQGSPRLITSSLRSKRRAMHSKQRSSSDINNIPLHPANPTSLALAATSQQTIAAPLSPVRMVARALTVPPPLSSNAHSQSPRPSPAAASAADAAPASPASAAGAVAPLLGASAAPASSAATVAASRSAVKSVRPVCSSGKRPLRVLVVDDADSNRKLLARLVSRDGAAVCEQARDGQEAVNLIQSDVARFDVILYSTYQHTAPTRSQPDLPTCYRADHSLLLWCLC